jgi:esterase/lipase superfamily enzyme
MHREYHKWYSKTLGRDMEMLIHGHAGAAVLVFPTSMGRFHDYEDRGMVAALAGRIEAGALRLFCVDSVDTESWYNRWAQPQARVKRHIEYERYILGDVIPLIQGKSGPQPVTVTGCSFGGYHCVNFAFRHPDLVARVVSMSGAFDIHQFLDGYYDDDCYFNCPVDYLPGQRDPWYLERYRKMDIVLACGEYDVCRADNERLSAILTGIGVGHYLDIWGDRAGHDWPWWQKMALKFF